MNRILFVDDEINGLQGLERSLRSMRKDWNTEFVDSGSKALQRMSETPFDVVVTDFHMPVMNGAELLNEVMGRYPKTIRLILTGSADEKLTLKCIGSTHQCLSKPCEAKELIDAILRATSISDSFENEDLKSLVLQMDRLPSLPTLYVEILRAVQDPQTTIEELGRILGRDIGMTAKILKLVNSGYFALDQPISSPTEAAMFLGVDTIQTLVLSAHIFSQYESMDIGGLSMTELMEHSMGTGRVAKKIAAECGGRRLAEEAFVAGMLHDAGKLILAANFPDQYRAAMKAAIGKNMAPTLAEREYFKADHADVGGYLLGLWGLPAPIVEAIALHHSPSRALHKSFNSLTAVHVADFLSHEGGSLTSGLPQDQIDTDYLDEVGVLDKLEDWKAQFGGNEGAAPD